MFKAKEIIELLKEVIKTLNEVKENQPVRYDQKVKDLVKLKRKLMKCNDLNSIWNEIEDTNIRKDRLLKGLDENEDYFDTVKSRAINTVHTAIAKEVCRYYK